MQLVRELNLVFFLDTMLCGLSTVPGMTSSSYHHLMLSSYPSPTFRMKWTVSVVDLGVVTRREGQSVSILRSTSSSIPQTSSRSVDAPIHQILIPLIRGRNAFARSRGILTVMAKLSRG